MCASSLVANGMLLGAGVAERLKANTRGGPVGAKPMAVPLGGDGLPGCVEPGCVGFVVPCCTVLCVVLICGGGVVFGSGGFGLPDWFCACWRLLERSPEIVWVMPLLVTVVSVGMTVAPPVLPECPSSCSVCCASSPGGTGNGCEAGPFLSTVDSKPGRLIICGSPTLPVTLRCSP